MVRGGVRMHPIDRSDRKMEGEIDDPGEAEARETLGYAGADALQRLDFREQGIEQVGAHQRRP
jgi:hypothetical protein